MTPIYNQIGQLIGFVGNNILFTPTGSGIGFLRNRNIFSNRSEYWGRLVKVRGKLVWIRAQ